MARLDFDRKNLSADIGASVTMALVAVPDTIASAILAGVNPIYGFNALNHQISDCVKLYACATLQV